MALGYVETAHATLATPADPLLMRAGGRLDHVQVAYETYGTLAPARDNVVFVCHALTGDANAAGLHLGAKRRGWWDNMIGPGKPVDTDRLFVVSANMLGGCSGTTGPSSIDPATGRRHGPDFPLLHMGDVVEVHRRLLRELGIDRLYGAIGGSLGGMQVLQWVIDAPAEIERAVLVAVSGRISTENIAFSSVAREAIMSDPDFHGGRYAEAGVVPARGLKVARMMAHINYVSGRSLASKFGHRRVDRGSGPGPMTLDPDFEVESYLQHQGSTFVERFDALTYLYLTRLLDYFDPFAEPGTAAALRSTPTRFQVTSFDSDWRFSTAQGLATVAALREHGVDVDFAELASPYGHDSFLLEPPGYHDRVRSFLT